MSNELPPIPPRPDHGDSLPPLPSRPQHHDELPTVEARTAHETPDFRRLREEAAAPPPPPVANLPRRPGLSNRTIGVALAVILTAGIVGAGTARLVAPTNESSPPSPNTPISQTTAASTEAALQSAISRVQGSVVEVRVTARNVFQQSSQGSGVVVRPSGLIVTNYHVVGSAKDVEVVTASGQRIGAEVIATDEDEDLAVLRPQTTAGTGVDMVSDAQSSPRSGTTVFAIGSPFGLQNTVTAGVVSAYRQEDGKPIIQFDAPVNPGNSGGGLFDIEGKLIGIPTAIRSPVDGNVGIAFAVPASRVRAILARVS